jgi:hypothetical protein
MWAVPYGDLNPVLPVSSLSRTTRPPHLLLLEVFSAAGRKLSRRLLKFVVQNTLKLAYVHVSSKNVLGFVPQEPCFKAEGEIRRNGRKGMGGQKYRFIVTHKIANYKKVKV